MQFRASFDIDNASFKEDFGMEMEYILSRVKEELGDGKGSGIIRDTNGNRVGEWKILA